MDAQAATLLTTLKRPAASSDSKLSALNNLKSEIKHCRVPENAQATVFECLRVAITQQASSTLASSAFSTFGHLVKRLKIQDPAGQSITQLAPRLFPAFLDRLGDPREPLRSTSQQAFCELHSFFPVDIDAIIRDEAIGGSNPRAKQSGMQWVLKMHKEESMAFKSYTQSIVARLEDSDGTVRDSAKNTIVELFANAPDRAKTDLKRQMKAFAVRVSIESQVLAQLGPPSTGTSRPQTASAMDAEPEMTASTRSIPTTNHAAQFAETMNSEAAQPPPQEAVPMDPIYVNTRSELEDTFRDMLPCFEGRESEQNWTPRDKNVLKLRRMTKGNAPSEYHSSFMAGVKSCVEGILKVANSLRTTMSSNGCLLVQELAQTLGPAIDPHAEIFLQNFIKMTAATKHIASQNGKHTTDAIFQNCTYNSRMMQHIWHSAQDKNASIRQCSTDWLRTILARQASYKQHFESSGGLDLTEKCLKHGLEDANPKVKERMRATYWTFAKHWPEKANVIMSKLDPKSKASLEKDPNNPNAFLHASQANSTSRGPSRNAGAASRNALREKIAEQRKAKAAGNLPERPNSAMAQMSPAKPKSTLQSKESKLGPSNLKHSSRVVSGASSTSETPPTSSGQGAKKGSSLMSGPVRRPRRPEMPRPQTADPYASRRMMRPETPADNSPANSPPKGTGNSKTSLPTPAFGKSVRSTTHSPAGTLPKRSPKLGAGLGNSQYGSRPTSKGSTTAGDDNPTARDDDFTMVMPTTKGAVTTGRGQTPGTPGHKRPGLGQTMSVDRGTPVPAEDDGFTMVLPNLQNEQRAGSPLAYRSPLKAMFDEARELHGSMSPKPEERLRATPSQEERTPRSRSGSPSKNGSAQPEEVQIYEDPLTTESGDVPSENDRRPLGELPVNENISQPSPIDHEGTPSGPLSEADRTDLLRNRKLLTSGIERINAKSLDAHGFRRVLDLAKSPLPIWADSKSSTHSASRLHDLVSALTTYLTTFHATTTLISLPASKQIALLTQALALIRALLNLHRKRFTPAEPARLFTALLTLRAALPGSPSQQFLADLTRTADACIAASAGPEPCLDALLSDFLPATHSPTAPRATDMALGLTKSLLAASAAKGIDLGFERKAGIARTAARYLEDGDAEVRKGGVEVGCEVFGLYGDGEDGIGKEAFWEEMKGVEEGRLGLLTYYIAKRGRAGADGTA